MKKTTYVMTLTLLASLAGSLASGQESTFSSDKAQVEALIKQVETANNAGDVEAWVALFSEDAVYMAPGSPPVTTRQELTEVAKAGFVHDADIQIEPVEIQILGDWAFATTKVSGHVGLQNSDEVVIVDMKQIAIYRRAAGGEWKIARLIMNSNTY